MTIYQVFGRLNHICHEADLLARKTGFAHDAFLGHGVEHLPDIYEDTFLRDSAERILWTLQGAMLDVDYLRNPTHGEYILTLQPDGRYGYRTNDNEVHSFTCGDYVEAKIDNPETGRKTWIPSRIENDGEGYFLCQYRDSSLEGLTIRERW